MIERKIGERFVDDYGDYVECKEDDHSHFACCTKEGQICKYFSSLSGCGLQNMCLDSDRTDGKDVCFITIERK